MLVKSLSDSWYFFRNNLIGIAMIIVPIVAPIEIFTSLYEYFYSTDKLSFYEQFILIIIDLIAYPVYAVGVIFYITSRIYDKNIDVISLWMLGVKYWVPYVVLSFCIGVVVVCGLMLLVIPGIIFAVLYSFSEFELLLNKRSPIDAMRVSWSTAKEYIWVLLGGFIIITIVLYPPSYLLAAVFDNSSILYWVLDTLVNIIYAVLGVFYTIFAYRIYDFAKSDSNPLSSRET